ncbi:hypothetical protein LMH87_005197 [Akanthomyces muscarius]|uniref:Uncharacterized protein n=2 Tax=Akanthomyces TaxID=150366 RepID=A0A168KXG3_CORDF|nr:hypothetical protein LMH87_005197 [Akanthomyces muscarius]KAJ4163473.1 hypothetical protein LMH87_005197 [Akanthomyces muscarius]OAA82409.1 hypothetical protein LEL_01954 [Akanthomyces lecanii RCEF 1005]
MADSSPVAPTKLNAKRQKDDKDYHRHRLTDATFNPNRHPDPLEARPSPDPRFKTPDGVTEEMTQNWLSMIREAKAKTTS